MSFLVAADLAGFFAAEALLSLSRGKRGEPIAPMVVLRDAKGAREAQKLFATSIDAAVAEGHARLAKTTKPAALVYDAELTLPTTGTTSAVLLHLRDGATDHELLLAIPFRCGEDAEDFAVQRAKLLDAPEGLDDDDVQAILDAFWRGVDSNEEGARFWASHGEGE